MSGRPEALWGLFGQLDRLDGIGPKTAKLLAGVQIERPRDLLFTLPTSGVDRRLVESARELVPPAICTIEVEILRHLPATAPSRPHRVEVTDAVGPLQLVFFRARSKWLSSQLPIGERRIISGKLEAFDSQLQMAHPDYILEPAQADQLPAFEPIYPLTQGISQKLMRKAIGSALELLPEMGEWIDPALLQREKWPAWADALQAAHHPDGPGDLSAEAPARQRLAYDEIFAHQMTLSLARARRRDAPGRSTVGTGRLWNKLLAELPYSPTGAQLRAIKQIGDDMAAPHRMSRLLQGDVGAGKTLVAFAALLTAVEAGGQGVLMAPTEILAQQHAEGLSDLAAKIGLQMLALTGRDNGAQRQKKLAQIASGACDIVVGTHAVFQHDVQFADLRLAVIDEQHRFGVTQRMELGQKGRSVDVLVMTATPIPRSLALTQFGDMELSLLDEKPPGRQPITTALIGLSRLEEVIGRLSAAIDAGRQAYWVCPLVEPSDNLPRTSAQERFDYLCKRLPPGLVGLIHGQMPPAQKDQAMVDFIAGRTRILVATTVIEVGVDVPNASIMVIEHAEGFGLAQLHQLRGRVGRGSEKSTCLLLHDEMLSDTARRRLTILRETEDGFRISEEDLAMRGAGDVIGTAQSGLPRFRIADLERQARLMTLAQQDARLLLQHDPTLSSDRARAARQLLWLMEQDRAIKLITSG